MPKHLTPLWISCLALLCLTQASAQSLFSNRLPAGRIVARGKSLAIGSTTVKLYGTNLSNKACFPKDPRAEAKRLADRGYNWVRLHHVDSLIRKGENSAAELNEFVSALYDQGVRSSIDGRSDFKGYSKLSLYNGQNWADYKAYVAKLKPVLRNPGLWLFCLVNEGYTEVQNGSAMGKVDTFYQHMKGYVRGLGFKGLVGDGGDANINPVAWAPIVARQEIGLCHMYGVHPENGLYMTTDWKSRGEFLGVSTQLSSLCPNIPFVMQEWACLPFDENRGINSAFLLNEAYRRWFSGTCSFQLYSNWAQQRNEFSQVDNYSIITDYQRLIPELMGAAIIRYDKGALREHYWGKLAKPEKRDRNYRRITNEVSCILGPEKGTVIVKVSRTKRLVFLFDSDTIRGYKSTPQSYRGGTWFKTTSRGGKALDFNRGAAVKLDGTVTSAYMLDPWTLSRSAGLSKSGASFSPPRSVGVFEVNVEGARED